MTPLEMVREYSRVSQQRPSPPLYTTLIDEEYKEFKKAYVTVEELKELADLVYVIYGYANSRGFDLDEAVKRVHENNMGRMYQDDGTIQWRDDGKVLRNKSYPSVDLSDLV